MATIPKPEKAFSNPCGCGAQAGEPCPHTPIRCPHHWWYGDIKSLMPPLETALPPSKSTEGMKRECFNCGRKEIAEISWATLKA